MQITYFDPRIIAAQNPTGEITVPANTPEEYAAHRTALLNPSRGITLIDPPELPEEPDPAWFQLSVAAELKTQLEVIDAMSVRPLRAILSGMGTDFDTARLSALEAEAQGLRELIADGR